MGYCQVPFGKKKDKGITILDNDGAFEVGRERFQREDVELYSVWIINNKTP